MNSPPFFDLFDRIYVINLPSRLDRKQEMAQQLADVGLSFDHARVNLFEAIRPDDAGGFPSIGARGCFLSHMGVFQDAVSEGLERILIIEDDLNLEHDFAMKAGQVVSRLNSSNWSIFYGGYEIAPMPAKDGLLVMPPETTILTTHFVALQGAAIALMADYLRAMLDRPEGAPDGGPMQVDAAYCWFRRAHPDFRTLVTVPILGYQRASRTDVQDAPWYDEIPILGGLASLWRKTRNWMNWRK